MFKDQIKKSLFALVATTAAMIFGNALTVFAQFTFMGDYDRSFAPPNGYYIDPQNLDPAIPDANSEQSFLYTGALLADGSMLAGGQIYYRTFNGGDGGDFYIKKFLPSGALDASFGGGAGFVRTDFFRRRPNLQPWEQNAVPSYDIPGVLRAQPDGKILFAGSCDFSSPLGNPDPPNFGRDVCVVRYNADGSIDESFGNSTVITGNVNSQLYPFQVGAGRVALQSGVLENGNRHGTNGYIRDMAIQPDGKIVLVGETRDQIAPFVQGAPTPRLAGIVVRLNSNGSLDSSFGSGGIAKLVGPQINNAPSFDCWGPVRFYGVALQTDGRIVAVGHGGTTDNNCNYGEVFLITRWTAGGQIETTRRLDGNASVFAREKAVAARFAPGGKLIVSGSYQGKPTLAKFNLSDLSLDPSFAAGGIQSYSGNNYTLYVRAVQPDGKIIGIDDTNAGNGVVRFNPNGSGDLSFGNASWNGTAPGGRLNVNVTLPNGVTARGAASDVLVRPNGRVNLVGSAGGNCPPQLCRGWVSQQNTVFRVGIYSDFNNDGRSEISVYRPQDGVWHLLDSRDNNYSAFKWGVSTDKLAPADFDGDGRADLAVFRDGTWHVLQSSNAQIRYAYFGAAGDLPRPGDFDGDGLADVSVFRPSNGTWYRLNSSDGAFAAIQFGAASDHPMLGDYDADGKTDFTVFRPSTGVWYTFRSSDNQIRIDAFGSPGDIPVNGDFNGDSRADLAVFRPSNRTWYIARPDGVPAQNFDSIEFGVSTDVPVPSDYDNDGKTDVAIYRGGTWWIRRSGSNDVISTLFGLSTDQPVAAAYLP